MRGALSHTKLAQAQITSLISKQAADRSDNFQCIFIGITTPCVRHHLVTEIWSSIINGYTDSVCFNGVLWVRFWPRKFGVELQAMTITTI